MLEGQMIKMIINWDGLGHKFYIYAWISNTYIFEEN